MSKKKAQANLGRKAWNLFASVKLALSLLLALAVFSIAGTILPQNQHPAVYQQMLGDYAPLVRLLGLDDMYHAWWFLALLALLAANLVVCSLDRLPTTLKALRKDPDHELDHPRKAGKELLLAVAPEQAAQSARLILAKAVGPVHQKEAQGRVTLFAQRGAWSRFGVYIVHASVLIIFAGAIIGLLWGFDGYMNVSEGGQENVVRLMRGGELPLDFAVRLDKFSIEHYQNGMVSEYRSKLSFVKDGKALLTRDIVVNDPAKFEHVDFYQSSFGYDLGRAELLIGSQRLQLPPGGRAGLADGGMVTLRPNPQLVNQGADYAGVWAQLLLSTPGQGPRSLALFGPDSDRPALSAQISQMDTTEDEQNIYLKRLVITIFGLGAPQRVEFTGPGHKHLAGGGEAWLMDFSPLMNMGMFYQGPMARLGLHLPGQDPLDLTAFKAKDGAAADQAPPPVRLTKAELIAYTGLQAKFDPGVWFVWVGCVSMVLGFIVAFYFSHRKVWIIIERHDGGSRLSLAGGANKNRAGLGLLLNKIALELEQKPNGGSE